MAAGGLGRLPGVRAEDDAVEFQDSGLPPQAVGEIRRNGNDLFAQDSGGVFNLRGSAADVITRLISVDLVVVTGTTRLHRETEIATGIGVTIQDGGEFLVL